MKNILIAFFATIGFAACSDKVTFNDVDPDAKSIEIVVDFNDSIEDKEILKVEKDLGIDLKNNSPLFGQTKIMRAEVSVADLEDIEDYLEDLEAVETAGTNAYIKVELPKGAEIDRFSWYGVGTDFPNDPLYDAQWNFEMIGVEQAWGTSTGEGVVVAVLDTGLSDGKGKYGRVPDLGSTKFVEGFNLIDNNADPYDMFGHGTHVAGTIAQSTNNGMGVTGIAYNSSLMSVKVLNDNGMGSVADIAEGIRWAADNGAHIINMSLGGGLYSPVMEAAVKYAYDKNVFLACAAGNGSRGVIEYPAGYEGCHAVSAVNIHGSLSWYSSYGESGLGTGLFIAAPGGDTKNDGPQGGILQDTIKQNSPDKHGYYPFQGTSMATPHVAGVAALIIQTIGVDEYTVQMVEEVFEESALDKGDSSKYGHGLIDAQQAVITAGDKDSDEDSGLTYLLLTLIGIGLAVIARITE